MWSDTYVVTNVTSNNPLNGEKSTTATISKTTAGPAGHHIPMGPMLQINLTDEADIAAAQPGAEAKIEVSFTPPPKA